jgi:hypothetical protein
MTGQCAETWQTIERRCACDAERAAAITPLRVKFTSKDGQVQLLNGWWSDMFGTLPNLPVNRLVVPLIDCCMRAGVAHGHSAECIRAEAVAVPGAACGQIWGICFLHQPHLLRRVTQSRTTTRIAAGPVLLSPRTEIFLQVTDISQLGSVTEVASILLPREVQVCACAACRWTLQSFIHVH